MTTTNPFSARRSRPARRRRTLVLALLATISLSACGADEDSDQAAGAPDASTPASSPSPASGDQDAGASDGTPIRITLGDTALTARLDDNATARDLAAQLPLSLTFRDHNNVEKTAPLPRQLSLDGAPEGHNPAAGDIGYWAPDGDLVFYYDNDAPILQRHRAHRGVRRRHQRARAPTRRLQRHHRTGRVAHRRPQRAG
jgi:Cyclophilin-like family